MYSIIIWCFEKLVPNVGFWPNSADGVQDSSLLTWKNHEFLILAQAVLALYRFQWNLTAGTITPSAAGAI
jgi:hypothetical protein